MQIYVVFKNKFLGVLSEQINQFKFVYDDKITSSDYVHSLPNKENINRHLFAIFDDLIPENPVKIEALKAQNNIKSTIEILLHLDNIHGSFEFYNSLKEFDLSDELKVFEYRAIKNEILGNYSYPEILKSYRLQELPEHAIVNNTLGLSGFQEKYAVSKDDTNHLIQYVENEATEYFIKPFNIEQTHFNRGQLRFNSYKKRYYPYLLVNEHIFMSLAKEFGFDVPYNGLIKDNVYNEYHLVIKRFDRYKTIYKFDHHTINSLLNKVSTDKYKVTVKDVIQVAKQYLDIDEMLILFKFIVFSVIISHGDLHAKNISLIYASNDFHDKSMVLAPVYDVLTTNIYGGFQSDVDIGMKLNNKTKNIRREDLVAIAELAEISQDIAIKSINEFSIKFINTFEEHINKLPNEIKSLTIKQSDYANDITLLNKYLRYFAQRQEYINKYLLETKPLAKNIFS